MFGRGTKARRHEGTQGNAKVYSPPCLRAFVPPCLPRSAFSFAEVLFAVIILGIGFIMIAAVFPVAIRQSQSTNDETAAAAIARAGANYIAQNTTATYMPKDINAGTTGMIGIPTKGNLTSFNFWQTIRGNVISQDDPRYAYVSMYFRGVDVNGTAVTPHPYAQVVTICVQATEAPTFTATDYVNSTNNDYTHRVNLQPRPVRITIANGIAGDVDLIGFEDSAQADAFVSPNSAVNAVAEGAYVVVRSDTFNGGALIGNIFRVGARRPELDGQSAKSYLSTGSSVTANFAGQQVWELIPGNDFTPIPAGASNIPPAVEAPSTPIEAWIVGRSADATGTVFSGPAMDVSAYSTFVSVPSQ